MDKECQVIRLPSPAFIVNEFSGMQNAELKAYMNPKKPPTG